MTSDEKEKLIKYLKRCNNLTIKTENSFEKEITKVIKITKNENN